MNLTLYLKFLEFLVGSCVLLFCISYKGKMKYIALQVQI